MARNKRPTKSTSSTKQARAPRRMRDSRPSEANPHGIRGGFVEYPIAEAFPTAAEMLDHLLTSDDYAVKRATDGLLPGLNGFVFRGHEDHTWKLLPVAHRFIEPHPLWTHAPQPPLYPSPKTPNERRKFLGDHLFEELAAVRHVLQAADKLGLPTPIDYRYMNLHRDEYKRLWNEEDATYENPFPDERLLPAIALAQHNGVPTRLLDWTESPLVAAFFAAEGAWRATKEGRKSSRW